MRPYLVRHVQDPDLHATRSASPQVCCARRSRRRSPRRCRQMMFSVVQNGTGTSAQISGFEVGGKTGTAQNGTDANGQPRRPPAGSSDSPGRTASPSPRSACSWRTRATGGSGVRPAIGGDVLQAAVDAAGASDELRWDPALCSAGRYRLDEHIAGGGMGDVWRGIDEVLGRTVAVKILLPSLVAEPGFAERFRDEARTMATINHPGVVNVYDYGADARRHLSGHGVRRGRRAVQDPVPGRPVDPGADHVAGRAGGRRAAGRARQGHRAPRREAGQPAGPPERHARAHRLRHRPTRSGRQQSHRGRIGARHRVVHLAGAGLGSRRFAPVRRVRARRRRLPVPGRPAAVRGRQPDRDRASSTSRPFRRRCRPMSRRPHERWSSAAWRRLRARAFRAPPRSRPPLGVPEPGRPSRRSRSTTPHRPSRSRPGRRPPPPVRCHVRRSWRRSRVRSSSRTRNIVRSRNREVPLRSATARR